MNLGFLVMLLPHNVGSGSPEKWSVTTAFEKRVLASGLPSASPVSFCQYSIQRISTAQGSFVAFQGFLLSPTFEWLLKDGVLAFFGSCFDRH